MIDNENSNKLFEDFKKKTYEELEELANNPDITYSDYVVLSIARGIKEIEDGIPRSTSRSGFWRTIRRKI